MPEPLPDPDAERTPCPQCAELVSWRALPVHYVLAHQLPSTTAPRRPRQETE